MTYISFIKHLFSGSAKKSDDILKSVIFIIITLSAFNVFIDIALGLIGKREALDQSRQMRSLTPSVLDFFILAVISPIIEETAFRLNLSRKNRDVIISLSCLLAVFSSWAIWFCVKENYFLKILEITALEIIFFIIFLVILRIFFDGANSQLNFIGKLQNKQQIMVYLTSGLFALIHFLYEMNFENEQFVSLMYYVCDYFIFGLCMAYMRLRISFSASIIFHIVLNGLALL